MGSLSLKKKILVGYGVAFLLVALIAWLAVTNLEKLGEATDGILRENYRSILAAENMIDALERQDSGVLIMFLGDRHKGVGQFREAETEFRSWLAKAKDNITIDGEQELVESIGTEYAAYIERFEELTQVQSDLEPMTRSFIETYQITVHPLFSVVRERCVDLRKLNEDTMYVASLDAGDVATSAKWSTVIFSAALSMVALVFCLLLAERIVRPLARFMDASRKISQGDYSVSIPVFSSDELGTLAGEFNHMASQLSVFHELNIDKIIAEKNKNEAILSCIDDAIVVLDTQLVAISINPAARRVLSLEFENERRLRLYEIVSDESVICLVSAVVETGVRQEVSDEKRILVIELSGEKRHYLYSATPVSGRDSGVIGVILMLRDITRLREIERMKSEFVTAASHELRTPLQSLGMSVDLLIEHAIENLAEKDRELLKAAHEEVSRMKKLVSDLLDLSKIEAGKIDLDFENVSATTLFKTACSVFRSQIEMKEIEFRTELADDLPQVRADANKIAWVLTNLISNAIRYVSRKGHIRLIATRVGANVHVSVKDDGPGIPDEYHEKVFQKFIQVKGQEGGTGLGLAICKEIVQAHHGSIWVESSPTRGSTFTFTLPVAS
ncbi:MAG: cell wall metabolism sensor histidine kinase WalK [Planctomycetes bacterium]|nr:cell wall metabolism sensor histidine kinase WalK [Planctomycetota bacterium]